MIMRLESADPDRMPPALEPNAHDSRLRVICTMHPFASNSIANAYIL